MIDITNQHLVFNKKQIPIVEWKVWYQTPFGVTSDMIEAVQRCMEASLDPELHVTPVPVAFGNDGSHEIFYVRR